jgi:hypothetical protein
MGETLPVCAILGFRDQLGYLTRSGVAPRLRFFEYQRAVHRYFETSAA